MIAILFSTLVFICIISFASYVYYRRKKSEENFVPITETDERYLELLKLKKKIRKVE